MTSIMPFIVVDPGLAGALLGAGQPAANSARPGGESAPPAGATSPALVFAGVLARAMMPAVGKDRAVAPYGTAITERAGEAAAAGTPEDLRDGKNGTRDESADSRVPGDVARDAAINDPSRMMSDPRLLQPEFRARLERVIARMKEDYGRDVTIAETWRSQQRQELLHDQGRTTPGTIVTWTHQSKHTDGLAADLLVDGRWDNAEGYARLQQTAREEGLRTLGARDPGHVELAGSASLEGLARLATITELSVEPGHSQPTTQEPGNVNKAETLAPAAWRTGVAHVATVASVASIASVAPVAAVAEVAGVARATRGTSRASPPAGEGRLDEGVTEVGSDPARGSAGPRGDAPVTIRHSVTGPEPLFAPAASAAERIAHVTALQDAKDQQPVSHMMLRIDNADGAEDRIRVDVRGTHVDATINVQDSSVAAQLADHIRELSRALEARDLNPDTLRARVTTAMLSATELDRSIAARGDAFQSRVGSLLADSTLPTARSRSDTHDERPQQDFARHRQRRNYPGDRQ